MDDSEALTRIGPRKAGSEPERRAARELERRLEQTGREAGMEPTRIRPNFALAHLIHAVAGVVASVLSVYVPAAGLLLALVTAVSAFGDLTGSFHLARLLTPARASQNVVSDEDGDKPGLIVLAAHYDSPVGGMLNGPRVRAWPKALLGSLGVITICSLGRVAGLEATWLTLIQFIPTVVLIALTPLLADTAIAEAVEDPAGDAAVDTVLRLAESHANKLDHFDLLVVLTGGSAHFGLGMNAWLKRHRDELEPQATAVISLDNIRDGQAALVAKGGAVFAARMHPTLIEIAREAGAEATTSGKVSDAYVARAAGIPALGMTTIERGEDEPDDVYEVAARLLERIDGEIGPLLNQSRSD